jgi:hypothetical protein
MDNAIQAVSDQYQPVSHQLAEVRNIRSQKHKKTQKSGVNEKLS